MTIVATFLILWTLIMAAVIVVLSLVQSFVALEWRCTLNYPLGRLFIAIAAIYLGLHVAGAITDSDL